MATADTSQEQRLAFSFWLDAERDCKEVLEVAQRPDSVGGQRPQPHLIDLFWAQRT